MAKPPKRPHLRSVKAGETASKPKKRPRVRVPDPPSCLTKYGREEWRRIAPELARLGLLSRIDRGALSSYCEAWAEFRKASEALEEKGLTFTTPNGYEQQRPEVGIRHSAMDRIRHFGQVLGLSPSARKALEVKDVAPPTASKPGPKKKSAKRFFSK